MSNAGALLDKARERRSIASDKALAERIGVQRSLVSGWRSGAVPMPDARIVEIAELAGEDAGAWLLNIHAEQDDAKIRSYWIALSKKLAAAAAVVLMAGAGASGVMSNGETQVAVFSAFSFLTPYTLCIHRPRRRSGSASLPSPERSTK